MSRRHRYLHDILTIAEDATVSSENQLSVRNVIFLTFFLPNALVGSAQLEVSPNGEDWYDYGEPLGEDGEAVTVEIGSFEKFRVTAGTQTSDVEIIVMAVEETT